MECSYNFTNSTLRLSALFEGVSFGAKFLFNTSNHTLGFLSTYPFPVLANEWDLQVPVTDAWDNKGDITIGNDVWIGFEAVIMAGVTIGDGAIIGSRAVVTKDVEPYSIVGSVPAKLIRMRFSKEKVQKLLNLKWWDWEEEKIKQKLPEIMNSEELEK